MCRVLKINRCIYYKKINWNPSRLKHKQHLLDEKILRIYHSRKSRYGAPKIQQTIKSKGIRISLKCMQRHMRSIGLRSIVMKRVSTSYREQGNIGSKNLLNKDFSTTKSKQNSVYILRIFMHKKKIGHIWLPL